MDYNPISIFFVEVIIPLEFMPIAFDVLIVLYCQGSQVGCLELSKQKKRVEMVLYLYFEKEIFEERNMVNLNSLIDLYHPL
jgi:hypothetical protein